MQMQSADADKRTEGLTNDDALTRGLTRYADYAEIPDPEVQFCLV